MAPLSVITNLLWQLRERDLKVDSTSLCYGVWHIICVKHILKTSYIYLREISDLCWFSLSISDLCNIKQIYVWTSDLWWDNVRTQNILAKCENYRNMIIISNICSSMRTNYKYMLYSLFQVHLLLAQLSFFCLRMFNFRLWENCRCYFFANFTELIFIHPSIAVS